MVKLNKNCSENFLAFVSTRARSGSRPINIRIRHVSFISCLCDIVILTLNPLTAGAAYIRGYIFY